MVIGPRRTVLPWFGLVTNDVRWSGDDYLLASTYSDVAKQWLSITHLSSMNRVVSESSAAAPTIPSLATNVLGESAVVIAEATGNPAVPRAHVYFDSDFSQPPPPPAAPTNVSAVGSPKHFTMTWSVGADADAVVVDVTRGENAYSFALAATTRSYTFNDPSITSVVLRSVNAGGMSNAVGALLEPPVRRRATR
jgi:hypothetical protein